MKEAFQVQNFAASSIDLIEKANRIIAEYAENSFTLTLRQLYYQLVARDILENKVQNYKRLGSILNDARYAGLVDWSAIEDRTRNLKGLSHWDSPADIIRSAAYSYAIDKWKDQDVRPELWVEKEALAGVVERAATEHDISYLSCRGYMSASEMYEAAQRARRRKERNKQETLIIYLGDHDPSGIDMSENDIPGRFRTFLSKYGLSDWVTIKRIALNRDQIDLYNPPPNPAKESDSRFMAYQEEHGDESWELDALDPSTLLELIDEALVDVRDDDAFERAKLREVQERRVLTAVVDNWPKVARTAAKWVKKDDEEVEE